MRVTYVEKNMKQQMSTSVEKLKCYRLICQQMRDFVAFFHSGPQTERAPICCQFPFIYKRTCVCAYIVPRYIIWPQKSFTQELNRVHWKISVTLCFPFLRFVLWTKKECNSVENLKHFKNFAFACTKSTSLLVCSKTVIC